MRLLHRPNPRNVTLRFSLPPDWNPNGKTITVIAQVKPRDLLAGFIWVEVVLHTQSDTSHPVVRGAVQETADAR